MIATWIMATAKGLHIGRLDILEPAMGQRFAPPDDRLSSCPESITPARYHCGWTKVMESGLAPSARPGMTAVGWSRNPTQPLP